VHPLHNVIDDTRTIVKFINIANTQLQQACVGSPTNTANSIGRLHRRPTAVFI
jgi:hypothetical protein